MAIVRFKTRSLIERFGSKPITISDALAKQYVDRRLAILVEKKVAEVEEVEVVDEVSSESQEEIVEEEVVEEEVVEEAAPAEEEKIEVKIKKNKKDK